MNFIDTYTTYQNSSVEFKERQLKELHERFKVEEDIDSILGLFQELDKSDHLNAIKIYNFFTLIKELLPEFSIENKQKITDLIYQSIELDKFKTYKLSEYYVVRLLRKFNDQLALEHAKTLFDNELTKAAGGHRWIRYFRLKNQRTYFDKALEFELDASENSTYSYCSIEDKDLEYLMKTKGSFERFAKILKANPKIAINLFYQRSRSGSEKASLSPQGKVILQYIQKNGKAYVYNNFEKIVIAILSFDYYSSGSESANLLIDSPINIWKDNLLKTHIFHQIGFHLVQHNPDFLWDILKIYEQPNHYLHGEELDFFVYSILPEQVERFVSEQLIEDWIFLDVYYALVRSDRLDKEVVIDKMHQYKKESIELSKLRQKEHEKQQLARIEQEHSEIRQEIEELKHTLSQKDDLMSERLLYLYEQNESLFTTDEQDLIKSQIDKILSSSITYNPASVSIVFDKDDPNRFTRPSYMSNETIERCVSIGKKLGMDLQIYQDRLVQFLPYLYQIEDILDILTPLTDVQLQGLIEVYKDGSRSGDLRYLHGGRLLLLYESGLVKFSSQTDQRGLLIDFVAILQSFIESDHPRISNYTKKRSLRMLGELDVDKTIIDKKYFIDIFYIKYKRREAEKRINYYNNILAGLKPSLTESEIQNFELALEANAILIQNYQDKNAIGWRLDQLINIDKSLVVKIPDGIYTVTGLLGEFGHGRDDGIMLGPLETILKYPDYQDKILEILKHSFEFEQEDNEIVSYLQGFVKRYYVTCGDEIQLIQELDSALSDNDKGKRFLQWYIYRNVDLDTKDIKILQLTSEIKNGLLLGNNEGDSDEPRNLSSEKKKSYNLNSEIENDVVVITEGKTDWRYLLRAADELYKTTKDSFYQNIQTNIKKFLNDFGRTNAKNFGCMFSQIYPSKKIIFVLDNDVNDDKFPTFKGTGKSQGAYHRIYGTDKDRGGVYQLKEGSINVYFLVIPRPDQFNRNKLFYNKNGHCLESYFSDKVLSSNFYNGRVLNDKKNVFEKFGKTLVKDDDYFLLHKDCVIGDDKITIFNLEGKCLYNYENTRRDKDAEQEKRDQFKYKSKDIFSKEIYDDYGGGIEIDTKTWERFKKIFDLLRRIVNHNNKSKS